MNLLELYNNGTLDINACLQETDTGYRKLDPGSYLYDMVLEYKYDDKFCHKFIELVYVTLAAWNMNSRGAKLSEYTDFENTILENKESFDSLRNSQIKDLNETDYEILRYLFLNLKLVASKTPLVTFSKAMHFFLPETIGPIDRQYTLNFYKGNTNIPNEIDKQFKLFKNIHQMYTDFAANVELSQYIQTVGWNRSEPKVIDNIIIGYQKLHSQNHGN